MSYSFPCSPKGGKISCKRPEGCKGNYGRRRGLMQQLTFAIRQENSIHKAIN